MRLKKGTRWLMPYPLGGRYRVAVTADHSNPGPITLNRPDTDITVTLQPGQRVVLQGNVVDEVQVEGDGQYSTEVL
jgi:hypothetical protein